jgi:acetolactate synthase I/II/III large subunit
MKKRVADIVMEVLSEYGISDCFAVVGGGAMHLDNALANCDTINKYFNHHEQACAMAAEAYARVSGKIAAVCVTSGPGGTNTLTGVMGAWQDSLPMIVLSGQVRYETTIASAGLPLRCRGIQEFDIINSIKNMTKYCNMITDPLSIKAEIIKALTIAMDGRRGPVWLDIPLNIQSAIIEENELYPTEESITNKSILNETELVEIIQKLRQAKRPCILVGNGVRNSDSIDEFRSLVNKIKIPVISAAIAADAMYRDYEGFFGMSGSIGPRVGNFILQNADVILSIGCSLGYKTTGFAQEEFAPNAYIIAVDIDEFEMKKPGVRINKCVKADIKTFCNLMIMLDCNIPKNEVWMDYCNKLNNRFTPFEGGLGAKPEDRVCSYYFWEKYEKYEPADSISVLGNNTANSSKLQIGVKNKDQRIVANNNCGSMGADLPETIGAAIAAKKEVICLTGDGSIMMNLQELQTIKHYNIPAKIIIFSNNGYGAIRQTCKNFFNGQEIGCTPDSGVSFPDFEKIAYAFDYEYMLCENNQQVEDSLKRLFASNKQIILEVHQKLDDPVIPKVMSRLLEDGSFATPALHDMAPFLEKDELDSLMFW